MKKIIFMLLVFLVTLSANENQENKLQTAADDNTMGLGLLHLYNDTIKAKFLFERSCESDYMLGCQNLGKLYVQIKEYDNAKDVLTKTCEANLTEGCYELGKLYLGLLDEFKPLKSLSLFKKACSDDYRDACFAIGAMYYEGVDKTIKKDYKKARKFFKKSCELNNEMGCEYMKKCD